MSIQRGDYVRPNNLSPGLPQGSVWRVACSAGALKLEPENEIARGVNPGVIIGCRFLPQYFDKVELCRGRWVAASLSALVRDTADPCRRTVCGVLSAQQVRSSWNRRTLSPSAQSEVLSGSVLLRSTSTRWCCAVGCG